MAQIIPVAPFDCVVFGGTGDLAVRKLLPALYHRDKDVQIPAGARILAISRKPLTAESFGNFIEEKIAPHLDSGERGSESWARFRQKLSYVALDGEGEAGWEDLRAALGPSSDRVRVFY